MRTVSVTYQDDNGKHKVELNPITGELFLDKDLSKNGKIVAKGETFTVVHKGESSFVDSADLSWLLAVTQIR